MVNNSQMPFKQRRLNHSCQQMNGRSPIHEYLRENVRVDLIQNPESLRCLLLTVMTLLAIWLLKPSPTLANPEAGYAPSPSLPPTASTRAATNHYVPPANPTRPMQPTGSTGTRGCHQDLTAFAPLSHTAQTISTHPTLAWYVPEEEARPLELNLYEQQENGQFKLLQRVQMESTPSLMTYTLPQDQPGLEVGRRYLWQVQLFCNPDRPSSAVVEEALIEVVPIPPDLRTSLAATRDRLQQAEKLAQAGIWYDALAAALEDRTHPYWLGLLNDLIHLESPEVSEAVINHRDRLQRIITAAEEFARERI